MPTAEQLLDQYRRQAEQHEAEAREWAARAGKETDETVRSEYQTHVWREQRAADILRRRLAELENRQHRNN